MLDARLHKSATQTLTAVFRIDDYVADPTEFLAISDGCGKANWAVVDGRDQATVRTRQLHSSEVARCKPPTFMIG
jgi:hypothetical protein